MSLVIIGAGMTGITLALTISYITKGCIPIDIVEAIYPKIDYCNFNSRAIALSHNTYQHFIKIGVWKNISDIATSIRKIHISNRGHTGFVTINADDYFINSLGKVVELDNIRLRLFNLLKKYPGITIHCPAKATLINRIKNKVFISLDNNNILESKLLVITDGSFSKLASQCGIEYQKKLYNQFATIANIFTDLNHEECAWERFTDNGHLAILPMSNKRSFLVWCHPLNDIDKILSWSNEYFCVKLQKAFGWRLGKIKNISNRFYYPLSLIVAKQYISHRIVLGGNSAQTLHPIIGQGFNLGLRDAISLSKIITKTWLNNEDYGEYVILNFYQQSRQFDKLSTIRLTDGLVTLFKNKWIPTFSGCDLGLIFMDLLDPLRDFLVRHSLGWVIY